MSSIPLYKSSLKNFLMDSLFYVASIGTVLFCSWYFFFAGKFFSTEAGSTDLRQFFQSIPVISILTIPLLVYRLRRYLTDDSLPVSFAQRFIVTGLSCLTAFMIPAFMLICVPVCVNQFGNVDWGTVATSYIGIIFYGLTAIFLTIFVFCLVKFNYAVSLFISCIILAVFNFIHFIPLYVKTGAAGAFILKKVSFAWQFQSFAKGLLDSRSIIFFVCCILIIVYLCQLLEKKRTGLKIKLSSVVLFFAGTVLMGFAFNTMYFKFDASQGKQFSVSQLSQNILARIDQPLRITYFRTPELTDLYPQAKEVSDFLETYSLESDSIIYSVENADPVKMNSLGITGYKQQYVTNSKTEILTLYSAVLIQYLDKEALIPFSINSSNLEYDLTRNIHQLAFDVQNKVYLLSGNNLDFSDRNTYAPQWLIQRGFDVQYIPYYSVISSVNRLNSSDSLVISGCTNFSEEECDAIEKAIDRGVKTFIAASPYTAAIDSDFSVSRNENKNLIRMLKKYGFEFDSALINDIACYPMEMTDAANPSGETIVKNYPLWLEILPQQNAPQGLYMFWASPIQCYKNTHAVAVSSQGSWQTDDDRNSSMPFNTNPFQIPATSQEADNPVKGPFTVAASINEDVHITVVSDQYFINNLVPEQITNLDFLTSQLFELNGQNEYAQLMLKARPVTNIYKITDGELFTETKNYTVIINFLFLPLALIILWISTALYRGRKIEK